MTTRCEIVSDFRRLEELFPDWARLWESDSRAEIFQSPEWAVAWWRCFGHRYTLCSMVVFADDRVVGIVPLAKRDGVVQFLGTPEADYADIICEEKSTPEVLEAALNTLHESLNGWKECLWAHLSADSRVMRHFRALPGNLTAHLHTVSTERYQTILMQDNRAAIFSSLLGKKHTRRLRNRIEKAGQVRFRNLQPQESGTHLEEFFHHHVRRHAAIGKLSAYAEPESRQFIRTLVETLGPQARFGVLELDGHSLAWSLGFQSNGKFLLYQHTFDMDASSFTPGELLLWNLFEYAKQSVSREFDFGSGNEPYKGRFANHERETFSLFIEPLGLKGRTRGLARSLQGSVVPYLADIRHAAKSHRPTLRAFRAARMWVQRNCGWDRKTKKQAAQTQKRLEVTAPPEIATISVPPHYPTSEDKKLLSRATSISKHW